MSTYVLIHGAWHGAWCWERVIPLLVSAGHTVVAPDLPGHGDDPTPLKEVKLSSYAGRICEVIDAQAEPVILVGHSMGGVAISQAAEQCAGRIRLLVYLAAFLLQDGQSLKDAEARIPNTVVAPNIVLSEDGSSATVKPEVIRRGFYGDCNDGDVQWATSRLQPQATAPIVTPVRISGANYGRVPRVYIECLRDAAITPPAQKAMYTAMPCQRVYGLDAGHSPFISMPDKLVEILLGLSGQG